MKSHGHPRQSIQPRNLLRHTLTLSRRPIFHQRPIATLFIDTLQHYRREGLYKLHAFVAMPDHIHLLLTPQDITLERTMQHIKGGFSRRMEQKQTIWQRGFADHRIRAPEYFIHHREYIHHNPVRAALCNHPEDFPYSSAYKPLTHS